MTKGRHATIGLGNPRLGSSFCFSRNQTRLWPRPIFPDIIDRQLTYASYTYEMMYGAIDGDFCHGLIHPELMGPFRPGPRAWPDNPIPVDGLYLCGAGCHGGPGVTFTPGYNCGYEVVEAADRTASAASA